jgi:copper homeostasis protein
MRNYELEVIAFDIASCSLAEQAGASRIELCANPMEGGTTPSWGMIAEARKATSIQLFPIIRPRGGDFLYNDLEFNIMCKDIEQCVELKCDGVVIGILDENGNVDQQRCAELVKKAGNLEVTFHRAFDRVNNPEVSLEQIIGLGCKRILTSGCHPKAEGSIPLLKKLTEQAENRIKIMVGSGVTSDNIIDLAVKTGTKSFHSSARKLTPSNMKYQNPEMREELSSFTIDPEEVRKMKEILEIHFQKN